MNANIHFQYVRSVSIPFREIYPTQRGGVNWNNACAVPRETKCEHAGEIKETSLLCVTLYYQRYKQQWNLENKTEWLPQAKAMGLSHTPHNLHTSIGDRPNEGSSPYPMFQ